MIFLQPMMQLTSILYTNENSVQSMSGRKKNVKTIIISVGKTDS